MNRRSPAERTLSEVLEDEKESHLRGGIYNKIQVLFTYHSNKIEGNRLTQEQVRYIYEINTIFSEETPVNVDDVLETVNHFDCINMIIDSIHLPLSEKFIKQLHQTLKRGTSDSRRDWFAVGDYKKLPNEVGGIKTTSPKKVREEIRQLIAEYNKKELITIEDIIDFHVKFEAIHPFQDGNGRVGRLIMFKECLRNNIVPFIISNDLKNFYYRGLSKWRHEPEQLIKTISIAQDQFKQHLDYFRIPYKDN